MIVPLRRELEMVYAYVEIEKARFEDKINVEYDIHQDLMGEEVPVLCIQPLVENSIKHGLLGKSSGGTVYVSVRRSNHTIYIIVRDNGIGMTREKLRELRNNEGGNTGIGFSNISRRIKKLRKGNIEIHSVEGKGTVVTISIRSLSYD